MPNRTSLTGSELFIVDNSDTDWKVLKYLHDWCQISQAIDIATGYFEIGSKQKWSDRAKDIFRQSGKIWDKSTRMKLKNCVIEAAVKEGIQSLNSHRRSPIDALVASLEAKLNKEGAK
jgi:hypothetical protein